MSVFFIIIDTDNTCTSTIGIFFTQSTSWCVKFTIFGASQCCSGGVEWGFDSHNGMNGEVVIFTDALLDHNYKQL